jgi:hypothetical protein
MPRPHEVLQAIDLCVKQNPVPFKQSSPREPTSKVVGPRYPVST